MFEQSLYNQEAFAPAPESHEGELFYKYEIKNWEFSPRIYKILAGATIANLLLIMIVGQTSLLTMKGCDSPFVGRVCQVLDTVYVGSILFGTPRDYVDQAYEKTELADADVTFVDVSSDTPPLEYPEGYFALANPDQYAMLQQQANDPSSGYIAPGIPNYTPPTPNDLLNTKPILPMPNSNAVIGDVPTSPLGNSNDDSTVATNGKKHGQRFPGAKLPNESANQLPGNTAATPTPEATPMSSDAVTAVEINKKPLTDFADDIVTKWSNNQIDLNQGFTVVLNGVLTPDGKLDRDKSKFDVTKQKGDPKMIDVAKAAIEAVGDSGYLTYLKSLNVDKFTVTLVQNDTQITAVITSGQKTAERAKLISSGLNNYIMIGKAVAKNPSDERTLLDAAKVTADGTSFVLNFALDKPIAQEMINRKLKEAQAKKAQQPQPTSVAPEKQNQNTAKY
jgi:hypothetical protein